MANLHKVRSPETVDARASFAEDSDPWSSDGLSGNFNQVSISAELH
ncbi:MAG TPA: hypothetical protein V6C85_21905 [Allocoleopsis sp.]